MGVQSAVDETRTAVVATAAGAVVGLG